MTGYPQLRLTDLRYSAPRDRLESPVAITSAGVVLGTLDPSTADLPAESVRVSDMRSIAAVKRITFPVTVLAHGRPVGRFVPGPVPVDPFRAARHLDPPGARREAHRALMADLRVIDSLEREATRRQRAAGRAHREHLATLGRHRHKLESALAALESAVDDRR